MTILTKMKVENIYISPGHNFFGRYGEEALKHETITVDSVQCVAGKGLVGDRFFDYKEDYKGQITFFSKEVFEKMSEALDVHDRSTAVVRRNVIVSGVDLNTLVGQRFTLQGIEFEGVRECSPCEWMDGAFAPGAMEFLKGQGGLRCRILTDGILETGS
jgi:MOSC domain-containing protein YiiM